MGDDTDSLEEMIEGDESVGEEEDRFGHSNRIGKLTRSLRLKVLNAVV